MTKPKPTRVTAFDISTLETIYADGRALGFVIERQKVEIRQLQVLLEKEQAENRLANLQLTRRHKEISMLRNQIKAFMDGRFRIRPRRLSRARLNVAGQNGTP